VNQLIELHDTRITAVRQDGGDVQLNLDAYVHMSEGRTGIDPGTGWMMPVRMTIRSATVVRDFEGDRLWITEGTLTIEGSPSPMHVTPMDPVRRKIGRVDLEGEHGEAVFRPQGRIPTDVAIELQQAVAAHRPKIEQAWTRHMAGQRWVKVAVDPLGGGLMVLAYPGTAYERVKGYEVNWCRIIGGRRP
jgi:hypothetical protein